MMFITSRASLRPVLTLLVAAAAVMFASQEHSPLAVAQQPLFRIEEQQLMSWAFENQPSLAAARKRSAELLAGQLDFVGAIGTLTPSQRRRLELAGQGDITRFFQQAETLIRQQPTGDLPQEEYNKIWNALSPVRTRYARGLHAHGSLFEKTVHTALDEKQAQAYEALEEERARRNYRALAMAAVAELEIKLPLTIKQRTRLLELIMSRTKPPRARVDDYLQYRLVMYKMSQIPVEELKPIFPESEWKLLSATMQEAKGWGQQFERMEAGQDQQLEAFF
jgi:hypothetical protein